MHPKTSLSPAAAKVLNLGAFTKEVLKAAQTFGQPLAMNDAQHLHVVREHEVSASRLA